MTLAPDPDHAGGGTGMADMLSVTVNGEPHELPAPASVAALLAGLALDLRKVAVERNQEIVPRSLYGQVFLGQGDRLEIVHFIGGG
jgi:thiamine biosynthesis protein ThiS